MLSILIIIKPYIVIKFGHGSFIFILKGTFRLYKIIIRRAKHTSHRFNKKLQCDKCRSNVFCVPLLVLALGDVLGGEMTMETNQYLNRLHLQGTLSASTQTTSKIQLRRVCALSSPTNKR